MRLSIAGIFPVMEMKVNKVWEDITMIKKIFLLIATISLLMLFQPLRAEEVPVGVSSAPYPVQINDQQTFVVNGNYLAQLIKNETPQTEEVLRVAMNVISSCQRLKRCPLTKEILANMVQAAFSKKTLVAKIIDFDQLIKSPVNSGLDRSDKPIQNKAYVGDPFLHDY